VSRVIIIIGAGIAGMAAAIGLRQLKIETSVIEQATELADMGSGISLWPNALKALASLGMDGAVRRLTIEEGNGAIRSWRGTLLFPLDLQELRRELGDVTVILHRAELLSTLRELAATADIRLGARCISFEQNDHLVKALLSDGTSVEVIFCLALTVSIRLFVRSSSAQTSRGTRVTSPGGASPSSNIIEYCLVFRWAVAVNSARLR
jgi:2-polyprenyl-6-methoxyphenol hydroxylase-like FAD-dependent oxidoreductase